MASKRETITSAAAELGLSKPGLETELSFAVPRATTTGERSMAAAAAADDTGFLVPWHRPAYEQTYGLKREEI